MSENNLIVLRAVGTKPNRLLDVALMITGCSLASVFRWHLTQGTSACMMELRKHVTMPDNASRDPKPVCQHFVRVDHTCIYMCVCVCYTVSEDNLLKQIRDLDEEIEKQKQDCEGISFCI